MRNFIIILIVSLLSLSGALGFRYYEQRKERLREEAYAEQVEAVQLRLYREGLNVFQNGEYDRAIDILKRCHLAFANRLLALAKKRAAQLHFSKALKLKDKNKYIAAAKEFSIASKLDPKNKRMKIEAESGSIKSEVAKLLEDAKVTASNHNYTRDDVESYVIKQVDKKGMRAKVLGTATMKDGNVFSGWVSLRKSSSSGKWRVVDYSYR